MRACQVSGGCAKAFVAQRDACGPSLSVEAQSNVLSFRVKLVPKYLFTPFQVMHQTSFFLIGSPRMLFHLCFFFVCLFAIQLILCHLDMCDYKSGSF